VKNFIVFLLFITVSPVWAVETIPMTPQMKNALFNDLSTNLACLCGCGVTLKSCPHESCSFAIPMRKRIWKMIDGGMDRKQIMASLVKERGEVVLAAPTFRGFNLFAWLTPFILILIVGFGIITLLRSWSGKQKLATASGPSDDELPPDEPDENDPQYKRLHDELERFES